MKIIAFSMLLLYLMTEQSLAELIVINPESSGTPQGRQGTVVWNLMDGDAAFLIANCSVIHGQQVVCDGFLLPTSSMKHLVGNNDTEMLSVLISWLLLFLLAKLGEVFARAWMI